MTPVTVWVPLPDILPPSNRESRHEHPQQAQRRRRFRGRRDGINAAFGQGTLEQRIACTPDMFKLCKSEIPNVSKIFSCMDPQKESPSPACNAVFSNDLIGPAKSEQAALKR